MTKHYTDEFRHDAVQYYLDNKNHITIKEAANSLGVGKSTLLKWIKQFRETGDTNSRGSGNYASDKDKEMAKLKRQLRDAQGAIEVLKKAIGILGK